MVLTLARRLECSITCRFKVHTHRAQQTGRVCEGYRALYVRNIAGGSTDDCRFSRWINLLATSRLAKREQFEILKLLSVVAVQARDSGSIFLRRSWQLLYRGLFVFITIPVLYRNGVYSMYLYYFSYRVRRFYATIPFGREHKHPSLPSARKF